MATGVFDLFAKLVLDTSQYTSGLTNAKSLAGSIGSGIKKGFTALATAGAAAFTAASAATTKFVKDSVSAGMEFDKSMSQVAATMGMTVDQMMADVQTATINGEEFTGNLRDYALKMGSETAFSAKQAADALNYMALAGYDTQTSMEMLPNVLNLAAAGTMDLATASDMVTDTQTAFGISLERTSQMVDEMAKAASTGNTSVQQLGDAFLVVGGLASELNGGMVAMADGTKATVDGVQELEIALTAMANAGIKGSEAGTHMRNLIMRLSSPSAEGAKKLEEMGVAVFDAAGNMRSFNDIFTDLNKNLGKMTQEQKITTIGDLFNARDLSSAEALLNAVSQDWDKIGESILNAEGAAQQMADVQLDNLAGDVTLFKSALEGAQIAISDSLSPTLREFVQFGTDSITKLSNAFQEGGLTKAIEALQPILQEGIGKVTSLLPTAIQVVSRLLDAIIDNLPSMLETALPEIVNAITTAMTSLAEQLPKLVPILTSAMSAVLTEAPKILDAILKSIPELLEGDGGTELLDAFIGFIVGIANSLAENMAPIANAIATAIPNIVNALMEHIDELIEAGNTIWSALIDALTQDNGVLDAVVKLISGVLTAVTDNIDTILLAEQDLVVTLLEKLLMPETINKLASTVGKLISTVVLAAGKLIGSDAGFLVELGKSVVEALAKINWVDLLANMWKELGKGVLSGFGFEMDGWDEYWEDFGGRVFDWVDNFTVDLGTAIIDGASEAWDRFWSWFDETVVGKFTSFAGDALTWGEDLINGFITGMDDGEVTKKVTGLAEIITNFIGFSEPKKGPLSRFHTFAPDMVDLFVSGIEDSQKKVEAALASTFVMPEIEDKNGGKTENAENATGQQRGGVVINFTQNNTSPKELNAYEIWRESQRAIDMMRMQLQGV